MYFVFPWRSSLKYFSRILHVKHIAILMSIWVVVPLVSTRWKSFCIILRNRKYPNTSNNVMHLTGAVRYYRCSNARQTARANDIVMIFLCHSRVIRRCECDGRKINFLNDSDWRLFNTDLQSISFSTLGQHNHSTYNHIINYHYPHFYWFRLCFVGTTVCHKLTIMGCNRIIISLFAGRFFVSAVRSSNTSAGQVGLWIIEIDCHLRPASSEFLNKWMSIVFDWRLGNSLFVNRWVYERSITTDFI